MSGYNITPRGKFRLLAALLGAGLLAGCGSSSAPTVANGAGGSAGTSGPISGDAIHVLSNRADLISGGDALVEVVLPANVAASTVRMTLNGKDVTPEFALRDNGRYMGLLTGMAVGRNVLTARIPGGAESSYAIINHPQGGPVFSGPQIQPWKCQAGALDAQCNQPPTYSYFYKSTLPPLNPTESQIKPYDSAHPPSDVATTTTQTGVTVPFIVRVETGYQDRDQYKIAVLYDPSKPWSAWAPQPQWNHKLVVTHGKSCNVSYGEAETLSVFQDYGDGLSTALFDLGIPLEGVDDIAGASPTVALGMGFAVMTTSLAHNGHNCNIATQAEALVMEKEHLVERYGELRYTIGVGCSGGSIVQQQIANAYPGIYQGITPQCSFPDTWTAATEVADFHLLNAYFENPSKWGSGVLWSPTSWGPVEGNPLPLDSIVSDSAFFGVVEPTQACNGISDAERYDPVKNPAGVRCGLPDYMINVLGPRPPSVWSANEKKLGHGFGGLPIDNVGVQYGLQTLRQGLITPAMFIDLNQKIGGVDIDINPVPNRLAADEPALANLYRSGAINEANNLKDVAIISLTGPDPGLAHDAWRTWAIRSRLDRVQDGHHDNQLIWFGAVPVVGDLTYTTQALIAMDRWLGEVEKDTRQVPLADKIVQDKPGDLTDRCTEIPGISTQDGLFVPLVGALVDPILGPLLNPILHPVLDPVNGLVVDPLLNTVCGIGAVQTLVQTRFESPRMVAGDAITTDANKCQLKPLNRNDNYGAIPFTDAQWAQMQKIFPEGVCDFSQPAVDRQLTVPWQTYQDSGGKVIYGGTAMPSPPKNSGGGWASPAFEEFSSGL